MKHKMNCQKLNKNKTEEASLKAEYSKLTRDLNQKLNTGANTKQRMQSNRRILEQKCDIDLV